MEYFRGRFTAIISVVSGLVAIISGWLFVDERYAHAEQYRIEQSSQVKAIDELRRSLEIRSIESEIRSVDDKIFFIQQKPKIDSSDGAVIDRYIRQRNDLTQQLQSLRK